MIARIWHGWTRPEDADAYEKLLQQRILPGIDGREIDGYRGAHLLRDDRDDESEFVTVLWFDSMAAVGEFAGEDHAGAVVPEEARRLLERFDQRSQHYRVRRTPD